MNKVTREDWDQVHQLACDLLNAYEIGEDESDEIRERLLKKLDELQERYGPIPQILSTRADYTGDHEIAIRLLEQALETETGADRVHTVDSLAWRYVEVLETCRSISLVALKLRTLLQEFRQLLKEHPDEYYATQLKELEGRLNGSGTVSGE